MSSAMEAGVVVLPLETIEWFGFPARAVPTGIHFQGFTGHLGKSDERSDEHKAESAQGVKKAVEPPAKPSAKGPRSRG